MPYRRQPFLADCEWTEFQKMCNVKKMILSLKMHNDLIFSNSLIIHQVKTKKITTVREVWIPGLNRYRFWCFYFSAYSLVFVLIEEIYQTLETLFYQLCKHLEFFQKYSAAHPIFNSLLGVWTSRCLLFMIYFESYGLCAAIVRQKWKFMGGGRSHVEYSLQNCAKYWQKIALLMRHFHENSKTHQFCRNLFAIPLHNTVPGIHIGFFSKLSAG